MAKELDYIYLYDEDGNEEKMQVVTYFKIEDTNQEYIVVTPAGIETEEAYVLKCIIDEDGEETYVTIEDEAEFDIVSEAYELLMDEEI